MYAAYAKVELTETRETVGTGWLPPLPDLRDYSVEHAKVAAIASKLKIAATPRRPRAIPPKADLREWCSPIENQGSLGSCSAHAGMGIVEYHERRAFGRYVDGSRLFLYKVTRNLMGVTGDTGAWLRTVMGALALCGVPAERYWPYVIGDYDNEPTAFVYGIADNFEALVYFCHDPLGATLPPATVLASVKAWIAAGIPVMFGFWGFPSFGDVDVKGGIPYPCPGERAQWGHAVDAVGFDDGLKITNTHCKKATTGALLIRNSWGTSWGDHGYGWLPYEYVLNKLARDFWSLSSMKWVDTGNFGL